MVSTVLNLHLNRYYEDFMLYLRFFSFDFYLFESRIKEY